MERLTTKEKMEELTAKGNLTEDEKIYYTLGLVENDFESNKIFTKAQLNLAITQAVRTLVGLIKGKLSNEIALAVIREIKSKAVDGNIKVEELEKIEAEFTQQEKPSEKVVES